MLPRKIKLKISEITKFFIIRIDFIYSSNVQLGSLLLGLESLISSAIYRLSKKKGLGEGAISKQNMFVIMA